MVDKPYRFDPFQNLVNISWGPSDIYVYFTYCAHNAGGGRMTYEDDVKLGYTVGNPSIYPDQTPPTSTEYNRLVDQYMRNNYGYGYSVKAAANFSKYGLANVPVNVTNPGRLANGNWSMSLDVDSSGGEHVTDLPEGYVTPGSVSFKVKGFPLGDDDWQVPIHWEGPGGTEPNGGCHFAWSSASSDVNHRRKQLFGGWVPADGDPGPSASELSSFSLDFNISYSENGSTYDAVGMKVSRETGYPGDSENYTTDPTRLADPIWGFDYYGVKYDSLWNIVGLDYSIGFRRFVGAQQTVIVVFRKRLG